MSRRLSLTMLLGLITVAVLSFGLSAGAAPDEASGESELEAAQRHLAQLRMEEAAARAAHGNAVFQMGELETEIAATARDLAAAEAELAEAQRQLQELAAQMYTSGTVSYLDVLVGADDFSEFANQLQVWVDLVEEQRDTFDDLLAARDSLAEQKAELENQRDQQAAALADADAQMIEAEGLEGEAQAYLDSLNAQLREEMMAEQARQAELARQAGVKLAAKLAAQEAAAQEAAEDQAAAQETAVAQTAAQEAAEKQAAAQEAAEEQADLAAEAAAAREAELRAAQLYAEQKAEEEEQARIAAEKAAADEAAAEELAELRAAAEKAERLAEIAEEQEAARAADLADQREAELAAQEEAELAAQEQAEFDAQKRDELAAQERDEPDAQEGQQYSTSQDQDDASQEGQQYSTTQDDASQGGATTPEGTTSSSDDQYGGPSTGAMGAQPSAAGDDTGSESGEDVVAEASTHMGTPYVFSPPGPCEIGVGEDCSCHTMLVYAAFGISLPDSPGAQMGYGEPVSGAPQAGDLLFWNEDGSGITHVGIATGSGTTIHAQAGNAVTESPIDAIPGYVGARRLL